MSGEAGTGMRVVKAHAYGNDFLYVPADDLAGLDADLAALARRLCRRHTGIGADGLIVFDTGRERPRMRLINADGSASEVSGNGVRGLAAIVARDGGVSADSGEVCIDTDAGVKRLVLVERDRDTRFRFRADMGPPANLRQLSLEVAGERVTLGALAIGNPQCVLLADLDEARLHRLGPALQHHEAFPEGVNVEIATIEAPDRVRILIWERGVGPTTSSGTGSCAAAVVAAAFGGAARDLDVAAPGGVQRVTWTDATVLLTGWAEILFEGRWVA